MHSWQHLPTQSSSLWLLKSDGLLQLDLATSPPQYTQIPLPYGWMTNGLATFGKRSIIAPGEVEPQGVPKALLGVEVQSGEIAWEFPTGAFAFTPPAADAQLICAVDSYGTLIALNPGDGAPIWKQFPHLGDYPRNGIGPVLSQHLVLAVDSAGRLNAFHRSDGAPAWVFAPPEGAAIDFTPAVSGENAFALAGANLYRLQLADGRWRQIYRAERRSSQGWYFAPPVTNGKRVFLLEACWNPERKPAYALHALDAQRGKTLWRHLLDRRPRQPPTPGGDTLYFVDRDGQIFCLDAASGAIQWQEQLDDEPATPVIPGDKKLFAITRKPTLYIFTLNEPEIIIDEPPDVYLTRSEWHLAAGAFLLGNRPIQAGLSLMRGDDWEQARIAFSLDKDAHAQLSILLSQMKEEKKDAESALICEALAQLAIEQLGSKAKGEQAIALRLEEAAQHYLTAHDFANAHRCREKAAEIMETPRFHLTITAAKNTSWRVGHAALLHITLINQGYGQARWARLRITGAIEQPIPEYEFTDLLVGQGQEQPTVRIVPLQEGPLVLRIELTYRSYRTRQRGTAHFEHVISIEHNTAQEITEAIKHSKAIQIDKLFIPGATYNEIEIRDSRDISIGDHTRQQKENRMDPVTIVITALVAGLTAGITETAKSAIKDMYEELKKRLHKKVEIFPDARQALESVTRQPESKARQAFLAEELKKLNVASDTELIQLAQLLLQNLESVSGASSKFHVEIKDSQVGAIGDRNIVTQDISSAQPKKR